MKSLFVSLFAAVVLLMIGCQESVTDPGLDDQVAISNIEKSDPYLHGSIQLEGMLRDPYPVGNSFYLINGQIKYRFRIFSNDALQSSSKKSVSLHFETDADMQYFCTVCSPSAEDELSGFITDVSEDFVELGGNSTSTLEKTFSIQGREDGMVLKVRFLITYSRIELNAMWLALPNNNVATIINHY